MTQQQLSKFFESLGVIWRDINAIEYLMRVAIAQKDGEQHILPEAPFIKGKVYEKYPKAFTYTYFGDVVEKFNDRFPHITISAEIVQFRNAFAHGLIVELDHSGVVELVKFREHKKNKRLMVEFSIPLEAKRVTQMRQSFKELRRLIMNEVDEKNQPSGPAHT